MSTSGSDNVLTTMNELLKLQQEHGIENPFTAKQSPLVKKFTTKSSPWGRGLRHPVLVTGASNVGFRSIDSIAFPTPETNLPKEYSVTPTKGMTAMTLTGDLIRRCEKGEKAAYENAVDMIKEHIKGVSSQRTSLAAWNEDTSGKIAEVESISGSVIRLYDHYAKEGIAVSTQKKVGGRGTQFIRNGMKLVFAAVGGGSQAATYLTAVNRTARTVTVDSATGIDAADIVLYGEGTTSGTNNDYGAAMVGLPYIADTDNTYFGLSKSTYPVLQGVEAYMGASASTYGDFDDGKLQDFINKLENRNNDPVKLLVMSRQVYQEYYTASLRPQMQWAPGDKRDVGPGELFINGLPILIDQFCEPGAIYGLVDPSGICLHTETPIGWEMVGMDRTTNTTSGLFQDEFAIGMLFVGQMYSWRPWETGRMTGVETTMGPADGNY